MMKKTLLILSLLFLISCSKNTTPPKDILPRGEFIDIITDIQKAQSLLSMKADSTIDIRNMKLKAYSEEILKKHNVSEKRYNKSVDYYTADPDKLKEIMDEVVKKLNKDVS